MVVQGLLNGVRGSVLALVVAAGVGGIMASRQAPAALGLAAHGFSPESRSDQRDLRAEVARLSAQLQELREERAMPARVMDRDSASICYLYGEYSYQHPAAWTRPMHIHVSGSGFVVANGWIATNRHVADPGYADVHAASMREAGAAYRAQRLLAFCPGHSAPMELSHMVVSGDSDLAVMRFTPQEGDASPAPLPLAPAAARAGDSVLVLGYPMGIEGMLAKSPRLVARRLAMEENDYATARRLAALALIRPSATQGHIGDVVGDKLLYDAGTAQGASGAPIFNAHGEVIGVNSAYLDGFSGGTLGVSVEKLKPLLAKAGAR